MGTYSALADRFNPKPFEGELLVIRARDALRELAEIPAWRRAATRVRIVETDGNHSTCLTEHQAALAEILSYELANEPANVNVA